MQDNLDFVRERFGAKNVVSFTLHQDEVTPHIHALVVPVTTDGRLSNRDVFSPVSLRQLQTDYARAGYQLRPMEPWQNPLGYQAREQFALDLHIAELAEISNRKIGQLATVTSANALAHNWVRVLEKQLARSQELLVKTPQDSVPGFSIVVIKQNERIVVDSETRAKLEGEKQAFYRNEQFSYFFTGQVFDNVTTIPSLLWRTAAVPTNNYVVGRSISYRNILAYENEYFIPGYQWQRDYVYYGITPTTPKGPLRLNFKENFRMMRLSKGGISFMAGDGQDPVAPTVGSGNGYGPGVWMDGQYEFLLLITTNAKDGSISPRPFKFHAAPSSLYAISYRVSSFPGGGPTYYRITGITPKEFFPSISVGAWDLTVFSTAGTYQLYEENQTVDRTMESTVQTTFAANFEVNLSFGIVKSAKFGASGSKVETVKTTLHYITGSSDLGQQVLNFGDPVILSVNASYHGPNRGFER